MRLKTRKESVLFDLLDAQANVATRAAAAFYAMAVDFTDLPTHATRISDLEHEGDDLTHELQNRIATTFITPLDKEDLRALSQALDDVTDYIEAAAARAELYSLSNPRGELEPAAKLLSEAAELTESAVRCLRGGFTTNLSLRETLKEIHTVENLSDRTFRTALKNLFDEPGIEALTVIKWKELFDRIETAVDKCEDIAAIIGTIIDKYA